MVKKIVIGFVILIRIAVISGAAFVVTKNQKSRTGLKEITDQVATDLPTDQTEVTQATPNAESVATTTSSTQTTPTPKTTKKTTNQTAETSTTSTETGQDTSTSSTTSSDSSHSSSDSSSPSSSSPASSSSSSTPSSSSSSSHSSPSSSSSGPVTWQYDGSKWQPSSTPPNCGSTISLGTPVDLSAVESILYPGQIRGNDYKAHGGFRFNNSSNAVTVRAPYDAVIVDGVRYYENGVLQYIFDFQVSCGIAYRFDHLKTLSSALQTVADGLPEAKVDDTRTTTVSPPVTVTKNQTLATAIGETNNTFVDWGVYDLRQTNGVIKSNNTFASYGICWFDWLSSADAATVRGLPATANNSSSDYCK